MTLPVTTREENVMRRRQPPRSTSRSTAEDWKDIEVAAAGGPPLRAAVRAVRSGRCTREDALVAAALPARGATRDDDRGEKATLLAELPSLQGAGGVLASMGRIRSRPVRQ